MGLACSIQSLFLDRSSVILRLCNYQYKGSLLQTAQRDHRKIHSQREIKQIKFQLGETTLVKYTTTKKGTIQTHHNKNRGNINFN